MYTSHYGLRERPFDLSPSPRFLYLSGKHREALSNIHYGIFGRKGITLLIGEAGTGKTTLVRSALATANESNACCVSLSNPTLTRAEFFEFLAAGFGLSRWAGESKARFLIELQRLVGDRQRAGQATALIVDEAQSLPLELMEEVRLLANLDTDSDKLFPVVLVGQPPLATLLEQPELRQLKQRVALRCDLGALDLRETGAYIAGRIRIAGGEVANVFTRDAVTAIFERSGGIPRTISVICDNALVSGFAGDVKPIGREIVLEVCRDFRFKPVVAADARGPELVRAARVGNLATAGDATRDALPSRAELFAQLFRRRRFLFL
jgi:type II secretory pathway predicted ATPase ExeA